jgi:RimJ/RimL family protein N-acetyltransferase
MHSTPPAETFEWVFHDAAKVNAWIDAQGGGAAWPTSYEAFGVAQGGCLVAGLAFYDFNGTNAFANIAIADRMVFRRLLRLGLAYAFEQLALHRLTFIVRSDNIQSIKLVTALGAGHEATLREAGREKVDLHIYALFAESCEMWRKLRGKKRLDPRPG